MSSSTKAALKKVSIYYLDSLIRDAMFFGYCQRVIQNEGKTNIAENAQDFNHSILKGEFEEKTIEKSYYTFFEKLKSMK